MVVVSKTKAEILLNKDPGVAIWLYYGLVAIAAIAVSITFLPKNSIVDNLERYLLCIGALVSLNCRNRYAATVPTYHCL